MKLKFVEDISQEWVKYYSKHIFVINIVWKLSLFLHKYPKFINFPYNVKYESPFNEKPGLLCLSTGPAQRKVSQGLWKPRSPLQASTDHPLILSSVYIL